MVKVNVEYTIVNCAIVKVNVSEIKDESTNSIEKGISAYLKEYINSESEKILPKTDINTILNHIGGK